MSRRRSGGMPCWMAACAWAVGSLAVLAGIGTHGANAQSMEEEEPDPIVLITNNAAINNYVGIAIVDDEDHRIAQAFETGANAGGYSIDSIRLSFDKPRCDGAASVFSFIVEIAEGVTSTGTPSTIPGTADDNVLHRWTHTSTANSDLVFDQVGTSPNFYVEFDVDDTEHTTPKGATMTTLDSSTTYFIVIRHTNSGASGSFTCAEWSFAANGNTQTGTAAGWNFPSRGIRYSVSSGSWGHISGMSYLRLSVSGNEEEAPLPVVTVDSFTGTPPNEGDEAVFTLRRTEVDIASPLADVGYTVTQTAGDVLPGGATSPITGMVSFAADSPTAAVRVPTQGDAVDERDATLQLMLSNPAMDAGYTLGSDTSVEITVADDDAPEFTIADASGTEGAAGTVTFMVRKSIESWQTIMVDWRIVPGSGSAVAGDDYDNAIVNGTLTFAPTALTQPIEIALEDNGQSDGNRTFEVELSNVSPSGAATLPSDPTATGTIVDDELPSVSVSGNAPMEGSDAVFTLRRDGPTTGELVVPFTVTQTAGDMLPASPNLPSSATIGDGDSTATVNVPTQGDSVYEADATLRLELSTPESGAGYGLGSPSSFDIIISDDETPPVISITSPEVVEGNSGTVELRYVLTKEGETELPASVAYEIHSSSTATVGNDYTHMLDSPIEFTVAETTQQIVIEVNGDNLAEAEETLVVRLSSPMDATLMGGNPTLDGTGRIRDDDLLELSISNERVTEGDTGDTDTMTFTVTLGAETPNDVMVSYTIADDSATASDDYTVADAAGTLTFTAGGSLTQTIPAITVIGDMLTEGNETLTVTLSSPTCSNCPAGVTPILKSGEAVGTGTIVDNDAPTFTVSVDDVTEGDSGTSPMTFTVTMTTAWNQAVTVDYEFAAGTAAGEATAGQDYRASSGTLTFASAANGNPAETEKTIDIEIIGDTAAEPDETVTLTLSNATGGAQISQTDWAGTILSDDYEVTVAAAPASVAEPAAGQTADIAFTVTLAGTWTRNVAVDYSLDGGTATLDVDYSDATTQTDSGSATAGQLLFTQGVTVRTVSVTVNPDIVDDGGETVGIRILSPMGTVLASTQATITQAAPAVVSVQHGQTQEVDGTTTSVFQVSVQGGANRNFDIAFDWKITRIQEMSSGGSRTYTVDVLASSSSPVRLATGEDTADIEATLSQAVESTDQLGFEISGLDCGTGSCAVSQARSAQVLAAALSGGAAELDTAAVAVAFQPRRFAERETRIQQHALAGFGRTMATGIVGGIWQRANLHRSGDVTSTARIGNRSIDTAAMSSGDAGRVAREAARLFGVEAVQPPLAMAGDGDGFSEGASGDMAAWRNRTVMQDGEHLLERSRFSLVVGDEADGRSLGVWGSGFMSSFESEPEDGASVEGSAQVMLAGVDWRSGEILAGVALSRLSGDSDYKASSGGHTDMGAVETSLTGVIPYVHWLGVTGLGVWGSFGVGSGTAEMSNSGGAVEADVSMTMLALGAKGASRRRGMFDYAIRGDLFRTSMTAEQSAGFDELAAEASRIRLALEGASTRKTDSGGTMSNRFELGARMDSGDGAEGAGADVAGEVRYASADGGLEMAGRVSLLLLHSQEGFSEWGAGLDVAYAPGQGGRGLRLSLEPRWNVPQMGAVDSLWSGVVPVVDAEAAEAAKAGASLQARLGYGVGAFGDLALASPYSEMETSSGESRVRFGIELQGMPMSLERLRVNLYGERDETGEDVKRRAMLEARLGF